MWGGTSILFIALSAVSVAGEAWCSPRAILRGGGGLRPLAAGIVALRLRGGHMPDNIPTVDVDMDVEDRKRLHYDLDKDAASIASRCLSTRTVSTHQKRLQQPNHSVKKMAQRWLRPCNQNFFGHCVGLRFFSHSLFSHLTSIVHFSTFCFSTLNL